jgi:hypothetical protein
LAGQVFQWRHLGALHAGRCPQVATILPVKVVPAAARATLRRVLPIA